MPAEFRQHTATTNLTALFLSPENTPWRDPQLSDGALNAGRLIPRAGLKELIPEIALVISCEPKFGHRRRRRQGLEFIYYWIITRPKSCNDGVRFAGSSELRPVADHVSGE